MSTRHTDCHDCAELAAAAEKATHSASSTVETTSVQSVALEAARATNEEQLGRERSLAKQLNAQSTSMSSLSGTHATERRSAPVDFLGICSSVTLDLYIPRTLVIGSSAIAFIATSSISSLRHDEFSPGQVDELKAALEQARSELQQQKSMRKALMDALARVAALYVLCFHHLTRRLC